MASDSRKSVRLPRTCANCGAAWHFTAWGDRYLDDRVVFTRCICRECGFFSEATASILRSRFAAVGGGVNYIRANLRDEIVRRIVYLCVLAAGMVALAFAWHFWIAEAPPPDSPRGGYAKLVLVLAYGAFTLGAAGGAVYQVITLSRLINSLRTFDRRVGGLGDDHVLWAMARVTQSEFNGSFNEDSSLLLLRHVTRET